MLGANVGGRSAQPLERGARLALPSPEQQEAGSFGDAAAAKQQQQRPG